MELATFMWLLILIVIVVWPPLLNYFDAGFYNTMRREVGLSPPGFVFGLIWVCLYPCIVVAEIYHVLEAPSPLSGLWIATIAIFLFNITMNHRWTNLFFKEKAMWRAFINILLVWLSAVAVLVLYGVDAHWISFWVYLAYPIILLYPIFLNGVWAVRYVKKKMNK